MKFSAWNKSSEQHVKYSSSVLQEQFAPDMIDQIQRISVEFRNVVQPQFQRSWDIL